MPVDTPSIMRSVDVVLRRSGYIMCLHLRKHKCLRPIGCHVSHSTRQSSVLNLVPCFQPARPKNVCRLALGLDLYPYSFFLIGPLPQLSLIWSYIMPLLPSIVTSALTMEAVFISETLASTYESARHGILEQHNHNRHHRENLKSLKLMQIYLCENCGNQYIRLDQWYSNIFSLTAR
jgi:hypothetical protein